MPRVKLPLVSPLGNVEGDIALNGFADKHVDVFIDRGPTIRKRPGLEAFVSLAPSAAVNGLYWWREKLILIAVCNQVVYSIQENGTVTNLGTMTTGTPLRPKFAAMKDGATQTLLIANGGTLWKTTDPLTASSLSAIVSANSPTAAQGITFHNQKILVSESDSDTVLYSNVGDPDTWTGADTFEAESEPDSLVGISSGFGQVFLLGSRSIDQYYDTGSGFLRISGGAIPIGSQSPDTLVQTETGWMFFDNDKRVVEVVGSQTRVLSGKRAKDLQAVSNINDAAAFMAEIAGQSLYVLTFPNADQTFVYNRTTNEWSEFGYWDSGASTYREFKGLTYAYADDWQKHFCGSVNTDGDVWEWKVGEYQDDSEDIRCLVQTGWVDAGSSNRKFWRRLEFRVRRGIGINPANDAGVLVVQYRDENEGSWNTGRNISLGETSDTDFIVVMRNLGSSKARQFRFVMTYNTDFVISDAELEYMEQRG